MTTLHHPSAATEVTAAPFKPTAEASIPLLMSVVDMVWPDQSNHHGTLFGGAALAFLDRVAFIGASKVLRGTIVTASVGRMNFITPAPAGHPVECNVFVSRKGRRSVTLRLQLLSEDLLSGQRTECLSGEFVMVRKEQEAQCISEGSDSTTAASDGNLPQAPLGQATVTEIVFPGHANHRGILHGGPAMEWMAKAGFVAATREVRRTLVMASSGQMDFKLPAYVGEIVEVSATVQSVGTRSVHVRTQMWSESPTTGERRLCTTGKLVFVALPVT